MLDRLTLTNFKAWRKLELNFGRVTGLFGPNSSGKSSLIQLLLLLKQTKNATDRGLVLDFGGPNQFVNLGSYSDMVHGHDMSARVQWHLAWVLPQVLKISPPAGKRTDILFRGTRLETECGVFPGHKSILAAGFLRYRFDNRTFALEPKSDNATEYRLLPGDGPFHFVRNQGRPWALPGPVKTHLFPDQAKTYYQNADFLSAFEVEYENLMDRIFYLGPLREFPKREYQWAGASPQDVGMRGERSMDAILSASLRGEMRNLGPKKRLRTFQEMIAHWLKELRLIEEFTIEEIATGSNLYRARVKRDRFSAETLLTDVGFGISQVLPALVLLYYVPEGSTVLMEQPEIHLHPSVQSGLADVILAVARTRNVQVIIESHSEHLLRRLQRRVAEGKVEADDVKLYFTQAAKGVATLSDLDLNKEGEIRNWPENFFGDELSEISAIKKASLKRKLEAGA